MGTAVDLVSGMADVVTILTLFRQPVHGLACLARPQLVRRRVPARGRDRRVPARLRTVRHRHLRLAHHLGTVGVVCAALDNLTPVCRIVKKKPLPEVASATLLTCSLWETYGVLVGSGSLMASNGIGASVALLELAAALWVRCRRAAYVAIETT
ncbi:hypothetical protein MRX96_013957 [Rhipicephalus microplus]